MLIRNVGIWAGLILFIFSIVFFIYSLNYDYQSEFGPGPGMLPLWLSGFLALFSLLYILESSKKPIPFSQAFPSKDAARKIGIILGSLVLFLVLMLIVGFITSGVIFLFILLIREYKWYVSFGFAVGVSVGLFLLFDIFLQIPLPVNSLGW